MEHIVTYSHHREVHLSLLQISKVESFTKLVNRQKILTVVTKCSILGVRTPYRVKTIMILICVKIKIPTMQKCCPISLTNARNIKSSLNTFIFDRIEIYFLYKKTKMETKNFKYKYILIE